MAPDRTVTFSADAVAALCMHTWPLNVRELERGLAAALTVAHDRIELPHLPFALWSRSPNPLESAAATSVTAALASPTIPEDDAELRQN